MALQLTDTFPLSMFYKNRPLALLMTYLLTRDLSVYASALYIKKGHSGLATVHFMKIFVTIWTYFLDQLKC